MPALTLFLTDESATRRLGYLFGQLLPAGAVLLLQGNLGSGKTTFTQGLGQGLGITEPIVSPTFTLISEYPEGRVPLYHFDLYRLDPAEVDALHPEIYWDGSEFSPGIVAIEWADRLLEMPANYLQIQLAAAAKGGREIHIAAVGQTAPKWLQRIDAQISQFQ